MSLKPSAAAVAKSLQWCPTLYDPIDGSPPGSPIPGILQARTLEWVDISFSHVWKWEVKVKSPSRVQLLATPWATACQAPTFKFGYCIFQVFGYCVFLQFPQVEFVCFIAETFYLSIHFKSVWSIFPISTLKSLLDNSKICVLLALVSLDCLFSI